MKKAVITTGSKQYLVSEGETLQVELLNAEDKSVVFEPLLVINGESITVGTPTTKVSKVTAEVVDADTRGEKVRGVRFKAKKRVHKVHGHKQHLTSIKIVTIA